MNIFLSKFFKTNPAQEVTSSQSLSSLRLHLVINEENQICIYVHRLYRMCSAVFRPLTLVLLFHINAPHGEADLQRFFWASVHLPLGILFKPPELPCCQKVWVPAETPLHLPGALQVHCSDILFSHWQIAADRERNNVLFGITFWTYFT